MSEQRQRVVFFDFETGGLDPKKDAIIQAAVVAGDLVRVEGLETVVFEELESKNWLVQFDESAANPEALAGNHYDRKRWSREAIPSEQFRGEFDFLLAKHKKMEMISKAGKPYRVARGGGHNAASFDFEFLRTLYGNRFLAMGFQILDTYRAAQWVHLFDAKPPKFDLSSLCALYGIELEKAHDALSDIRATAHLAAALSSKILASS